MYKNCSYIKMDKIQWSELRSSSYRHNVFIARGYTMINVIDMAKKWNSRYFMCALSGDDVIGYVEWNDALKVVTIKNKAPFEWYVREGTNQEVQEVIRGINGCYEEGEISKRGRKSKSEATKVIKEEISDMNRIRALEKENETLRVKNTNYKNMIEKLINIADVMQYTNKKLTELIEKNEQDIN